MATILAEVNFWVTSRQMKMDVMAKAAMGTGMSTAAPHRAAHDVRDRPGALGEQVHHERPVHRPVALGEARRVHAVGLVGHRCGEQGRKANGALQRTGARRRRCRASGACSRGNRRRDGRHRRAGEETCWEYEQPAPGVQKDGQKRHLQGIQPDGVPPKCRRKANGHIAQHDGNGGGERQKSIAREKT